MLLAAVLSAGCATAAPKCYQYPQRDFKVCEASSAYVGKVCGRGRLGCADRANKIAWVASDGPQPETTIHAICFMLDEKPEDCEKIPLDSSPK